LIFIERSGSRGVVVTKPKARRPKIFLESSTRRLRFSMEFLHNLFNNPGLRKALVAIRIPLGIVVVILLFLYGRRELCFLAFAVSLFGELIQMWASGSLEKNEVLTIRGPYCLARNPMYLGRFFVLLGAVILSGNIFLIIAFVIIYYYYMVNRVKREEKHLEGIFGEPYRAYCGTVNRFVPRLRFKDKKRLLFFRVRLLIRNNEHLNLVGLIIFYALFYVVSPLL
jgi:protein-S-isoprenylcysteine O-methyltransferase Ste14